MRRLKSKFYDRDGRRIDITKITTEELQEETFYFFLAPEEISAINRIFKYIVPFTRSGHYFYDYDCGEFLCLENAQERLDKIKEVFERG